MKFKMAAAAILNLSFFVYFDQTVCFWWQPSTLLQNFIYLGQSAAELLMFVQKSKMATAAILDLIFVQYFGILHVARPG